MVEKERVHLGHVVSDTASVGFNFARSDSISTPSDSHFSRQISRLRGVLLSNGMDDEGCWRKVAGPDGISTSVIDFEAAATGATIVFEAMCTALSQHFSISARGTSCSSRVISVLVKDFERIAVGS